MKRRTFLLGTLFSLGTSRALAENARLPACKTMSLKHGDWTINSDVGSAVMTYTRYPDLEFSFLSLFYPAGRPDGTAVHTGQVYTGPNAEHGWFFKIGGPAVRVGGKEDPAAYGGLGANKYEIFADNKMIYSGQAPKIPYEYEGDERLHLPFLEFIDKNIADHFDPHPSVDKFDLTIKIYDVNDENKVVKQVTRPIAGMMHATAVGTRFQHGEFDRRNQGACFY